MNVGKAIYEILSNDAPVAAIVGTRIYPVRVPQKAAFPAVCYVIVTGEPNDTKSGPGDIDKLRIQIDATAPTYDAAQSLDAKIRTALDRKAGTFEGVTLDSVRYVTTMDDYDPDLNLFTRMSDYYFRVRR